MVCRHRTAGLILVLSLLIRLVNSQAQIRLDGSLGPQGDLTGPDYIIPAEVGQQRGGNLFHSFDRFHVGTGESATFTGPDQVNHLIGRVTGGQTSTIDGALQSTIPGASLFLLNPQGVIFGPDARLDVDGSFHASTADVLRFEDGNAFSTDLGEPRILTVAPPVAFGFLQVQPAPITVQGSKLHVPEGETLSLIGGNIDITGGTDDFFGFSEPTLDAPGGRIHLVSAGASGEVVVGTSETLSPPLVDTLERLGAITVSNAALLSTSGDGGGTVVIRGGNLTIDSSDIFADTVGDRDGAAMGIDIAVTETFVHTSEGAITTDSFGAGHAGDIRVAADLVRMGGEVVVGSGAFADGNAGDITIEASTVTLTGGALIESVSFELGQGGTVTIRATGDVTLAGADAEGLFSSGINVDSLSEAEGAGNAGNVWVEAKAVSLVDGAQISSSTMAGQGGTVTIRATEAVTLSGTGSLNDAIAFPSRITVMTFGSGDAGTIQLEAKMVHLSGGAEMSSSTSASGLGGTVTVRATEMVTLDGIGPDGIPTSINADTSPALIDVAATGAGGAVRIEAKTVAITGGARISSATRGPGHGGAVMVKASDAVALSGMSPEGLPSSITSETLGGLFEEERAGAGGTVLIEARTVSLSGGATMSSRTAFLGQGGTVTVIATDTIAIEGPNSRLTTNTDSSGAGGEINANARDIRLDHGATISSASSGTGNAGNILITTDTIQLSGDSTISTESETADGGEVRLTTETLTQLQNSQITAEAGSGSGGNISADSAFFVLQKSQLRANSFGGPGGNMIVQAEVFLADPASLVTASSELDVDGIVDIRAPVTEFSNTVTPLSKRFASAVFLFNQRCVTQHQTEPNSSFFLTGRDRVPAQPGELLPSPQSPIQGLTFQRISAVPVRVDDLDANAKHLRAPCPR